MHASRLRGTWASRCRKQIAGNRQGRCHLNDRVDMRGSPLSPFVPTRTTDPRNRSKFDYSAPIGSRVHIAAAHTPAVEMQTATPGQGVRWRRSGKQLPWIEENQDQREGNHVGFDKTSQDEARRCPIRPLPYECRDAEQEQPDREPVHLDVDQRPGHQRRSRSRNAARCRRDSAIGAAPLLHQQTARANRPKLTARSTALPSMSGNAPIGASNTASRGL